MSIRKINFVEDEYYHTYNRGNSKQKIFKDEKDCKRFVDLLYGANTTERFNFYNISEHKTVYENKNESPLVSIGAYCLMPNHFHILITTDGEQGISKFMQKVTTAYVMYFNKRYKRTGSLFEGKFKSTHLYSDRYLKYIFSYIHLNPLKLIDPEWKKRGLKNKKQSEEYLYEYKFSSLPSYLGSERKENAILNSRRFPKYFETTKNLLEEMSDWMSYVPKE